VTSSDPAPGRFEGRQLRVAALVAATMGLAFAVVAVLTGGAPDSVPPALDKAKKPTASVTQAAESAPRATQAPVGATPMAESAPTRLRIPSIEVDSDLMALGLKSDGTLETPPGPFPAGWFTGAPTPGELGPAIIVGHVRYETPGVFARLTDLRRGDEIDVNREDGSTATFRVTRLQHFAKSAFPTEKVYGNIDHPGLRLITCGGLDAETNEFEENVVVFADLAAHA
jgi:sortase (surface protein transpeptidase)